MFGKKKNIDEVSTVSKVEEEDKAKIESKEDPVVLSIKEHKALKNNKYNEKADLYNKSFVIKNKRTGMIVELRAESSIQAANFIGWRPRHTILIKEKDVSVEKEAKERIDSANAEIESKKENCPAL